MTEKQQEIYIRTKERLRRLGKENPADVIVALAEEIDHYRAKIRTLEEFIAKRERKHGNETGLVAELRNKQSRDNRDLLDRAADRIEELEARQHKQIEMKLKIKTNPNKELVKTVRAALEKNDGYCPCALFKNDDTKCMCKEFREQIAKGIPGKCHCELYEGVLKND